MLLEIKTLWVRYEGAEVLKGISCEVEEGSIVTFLGSNGAGKSTTLRAICGLKTPDSGEIWFNGKRIDGDSPQNIIKQGIGHVLEGRALFPYMTVFENLKVGAFLQKDKQQIDRNLKEIFANFPILKERQQQQARTLSGGEQQMLTIARALMGSPKLLLLDEPASGMNVPEAASAMELIRSIQQSGTTVVIVEHNMKVIMQLCSRIAVLNQGVKIAEGPPQEISKNEQVISVYLGKRRE